MRYIVLVAVAALCGCPPPPECAEDADCGERSVCDSGECHVLTCEERAPQFSCNAHATLTCVDPSAEVDPTCPCDAGFANFDDASPGCEDPSPEYASCCGCLAADDSCLDAGADQCIAALEAGATVSVDIGRCTPSSTCPGDCARVNCDNFGCTGY